MGRSNNKRFVAIYREDGSAVDLDVRLCDTFWCRLRGLQFRRALAPREGLLFVEKIASTVGTSIHMFNVPFSIGVVWFDADGVVVHTCLAKPWRPYYASSKPARYYLEAAPAILDDFKIGERFEFQFPD